MFFCWLEFLTKQRNFYFSENFDVPRILAGYRLTDLVREKGTFQELQVVWSVELLEFTRADVTILKYIDDDDSYSIRHWTDVPPEEL